MRYKFFFIILFFFSCTINSTKIENRIPYNTQGFAYIFNEQDHQSKIIGGKLDNSELQISINKLKIGALIKIINPKTKDYLVLKNIKKIEYPDFYKILITSSVAQKLKIDKDLPLVEIIEIKKNKSFVAEKAKIFNEEKKLPSNAPVTSVQISNISKNGNLEINKKKNEFYILIGSFYAEETAKFLKNRITEKISNFNSQKLTIHKKGLKEINLLSGPYKTINFMKNDYIQLKKFGFEELDIITND